MYNNLPKQQILIFSAAGELGGQLRGLFTWLQGLQKLIRVISNSAARTNQTSPDNIVFDTMSNRQLQTVMNLVN